jgi:RimJ/RimL family protein N-acetyltransferase
METRRLMLRPFEAADFDGLFAIHSRPDVARYLYWEPRTEEEVRAVLEKKINGRVMRSEGDSFSFAVILKATGQAVGDVSLLWVNAQHGTGEIGFAFHPDHQGQGYATEAARVVLQLAFEELKLHRVIGRLEARNTASARVLEKLGMRREGHLVENEYVKGEWQSELDYAILDREWRGVVGGSEPSR